MTVDTAREGGDSLLALNGELDLAGVPTLDAALEQAFASGAQRIVVDLTHLAFIDSSGMRALALAHRRAQREGPPIEFVRGGRIVMRALEITGIASELSFTDGPPA